MQHTRTQNVAGVRALDLFLGRDIRYNYVQRQQWNVVHLLHPVALPHFARVFMLVFVSHPTSVSRINPGTTPTCDNAKGRPTMPAPRIFLVMLNDTATIVVLRSCALGSADSGCGNCPLSGSLATIFQWSLTDSDWALAR